jgi:hypothetical protein
MTHDPLAVHRGDVVAAESALARARAKMSAAAEQHRISYHGIFGDSIFVLRSTAERWSKEAGIKGVQNAIRGFEVLRDGGHLAHWFRVDVHAAESADEMLAGLIINAGKKRRGEEV